MLKKLRVAADATLIALSLWTRMGAASPAHSVSTTKKTLADLIVYSGRYLSLVMFDHDHECGIGAVAPWAGHLWVITYLPTGPFGSDNKLYAFYHNLHRVTKPQSVGGTAANCLIHREPQQLFIGPYVIDAQGHIRVSMNLMSVQARASDHVRMSIGYRPTQQISKIMQCPRVAQRDHFANVLARVCAVASTVLGPSFLGSWLHAG